MRNAILKALRSALLLVLPGLVAWLTGRPFLFPSLGPTAYALSAGRRGGSGKKGGPAPLVVFVAHFWGVVFGMGSYYLLADGLTLNAVAGHGTVDMLRLSAAGTLSVAATVAAMEATKTPHSPACATTLIVSLGLLPTPTDASIILLSVFLMVVVHVVFSAKGEG